MPHIGAESAFVSQLVWQIRANWSKQRSLEQWHKNHPDVSDDIFDKLYTHAECCLRFAKLCNDLFCEGSLRDIWKKANSMYESQ